MGGVGNHAGDPLFVDFTGGDFRLGNASPALDSGDNAALPSDTLDLDNDGDTAESLPFDLDGLSRFVNDPAPDTGLGDAPISDRGAYERAPSGCSIADLSVPFGVLDFTDIVSFLGAFGAMDPLADLAPPMGVFDFTDVVAFLGAYGTGCP